VARTLKRWWALRLAQRERERLAARQRQALNRKRAAGWAVALWCQRHYRGRRARRRVKALREEWRRKQRAALRARLKPPPQEAGTVKKQPFR